MTNALSVTWGGGVNRRWWMYALWRAERPESSTVEGRRGKEGEKRGRKKSSVGGYGGRGMLPGQAA